MAAKVYYTSKGQPYIKLASGRAKFIKKTGAQRKRTAGISHATVPAGFGSVSLAALRKLAKGAATCIEVVTNKGKQKVCSTKSRTGGLAGKKRKTRRKKAA